MNKSTDGIKDYDEINGVDYEKYSCTNYGRKLSNRYVINT